MAKTVESIMKKAARDAVDDELEKRGLLEDENETLDNPFLLDSQASLKQPTKGVFDSFLSSLGYFGTIFKILPSGEWETKDYTINNPESIPDIDQFIVGLVNEKGWGDGKYIVTIRHPSKRGFHLKKQIIVSELTPQEKRERIIYKTKMSGGNIPESPWVDPVDAGMKIMDKVLQTSRAMTPPQTDIAQMSGVIADTFKSGVEVTKEALKIATPNPPQDGASTMVQLITALKDVLKPPETKQESLVQTLITLKDLGVISPQVKSDDNVFMNQLKLLREGLGLKFAHEIEGRRDDPMTMVEKVGSLVTALRPLVNPEAGPPSTLQLIFEAFSKFGGPLFDAIRDFAEAKKIEVHSRIRAAGGELPPPIMRRQIEPSVVTQQEGEPKSMNAIVSRIVNIVKTKDESQFQFLRETIFGFLGPQWIQGLIGGDISVDYVITLSKLQFGDTFDNEESKLYLYKFVAWLREQAKAHIKPVHEESRVQSPENIAADGEEIIGKCQVCGQEWDFTKTEWDMDNKICDCGGQLAQMSPPS